MMLFDNEVKIKWECNNQIEKINKKKLKLSF
jgi:hypothetical protein